MKRSCSIVLSLMLIVLILIAGCIPATAAESAEIPSVEEFVSLAKQANAYSTMLLGGLDSYWRVIRNHEFSPHYNAVWAEEHGYIAETLVVQMGFELKPVADPHSEKIHDIYSQTPYIALPAGITISDLENDFYKYFADDFFSLFSCGGDYCRRWALREDETGRAYITRAQMIPDETPLLTEAVWSSAQITRQSNGRIKMTMQSDPGDSEEWELTVLFKNTANGWRVCDGNIFALPLSAPQTGDSTPVYLTISLLSLAALTVTAVGASKKRKKAL